MVIQRYDSQSFLQLLGAHHFQGMAVRLAFDLALHLDMSTEVSVGIITSAEADVRRKVFWNVCNADQ
jgi:hypothetical protein